MHGEVKPVSTEGAERRGEDFARLGEKKVTGKWFMIDHRATFDQSTPNYLYDVTA